MLVINSRSDKLHSAYNRFKSRGMLDDPSDVNELIEGLTSYLIIYLWSMFSSALYPLASLFQDKETSDSDNNEENFNDDSFPAPGRHAEPSISLSRSITGMEYLTCWASFLADTSWVSKISAQEFTRRLSLESFLDLLLAYVARTYGLEGASQAKKTRMYLELSYSRFAIHPSAIAKSYAPSDYSGPSGMHHERIQAVLSWRNGQGQFDTVFIKSRPGARTITTGLVIGRVHQFFSFFLDNKRHSCAVVHMFEFVGDKPDEELRLWIVRPVFSNSQPKIKIIPLNAILRATHLIPVYSDERVSNKFSHTQTLDHFDEFYVNRFIDYHAFETAI